MRSAGSTSKWIVVAMVALLAALAWTSMRGDGSRPIPAPQPQVVAAPTDATPASDAQDASPASPAPDTTETTRPDAQVPSAASPAYPAFLPPEAIDTLERIARGGPYPHRQDDGVFGNRERRLPQQPRGYYREYTVETPGSRDRGARRIVTGGRPPIEYFYTDDHYRSFRRFTLDGHGVDAAEHGR
jgi:guanyl-specific ribonuclease Sa